MAFATLHDIVNNGFLQPSLAPGNQTATVQGAGVDCTKVDGPINAICHVGVATGSPSSFTVTSKLQESSDNSTWTDIVTQSTNPVQAAAGVVAMRGNREKQYVRTYHSIAFVGGTSPGINMSSAIVSQLRKFGNQPGDAGY